MKRTPIPMSADRHETLFIPVYIKPLFFLFALIGLVGCSPWQTINKLPSTAAGERPILKGTIYRDYWLNISGQKIADLKSAPGFPDSPDGTDTWTRLQAPVNVGDNFGSRVTGVLYPPDDGNYTFYLSSDDQSQFSLSTNSDPANLKTIASVPSWVGAFSYSRFPEQVSVPVTLKAGVPYAFELLHKEGTGDDHVAVEWEGPALARQVINSDYIASGVKGASTSPASADYRAGYTAGYRIGYFDGGERLTFNDAYPPLDQDRDGIYDNWEVLNGLDPTNAADAESDTDNDLLTAFDEFLARTSPSNPDTDGDGIPDGVEYAYNLDPTDPADGALDLDGDGVTNVAEYKAGTDFSDPKSLPVSRLAGFGAQLFNGTNFDTFELTRLDKAIDFKWVYGSPDPSVRADRFSVRWIGEFLPPHPSGTESYRITVTADDGVRLWIDGNLAINQWKNQSATSYSTTVSLDASARASLRMEYYDYGGNATAQLAITDSSGQSVNTANTVTSVDPENVASPDSDGDGIPDNWELQYGLNPYVDDANQVNNTGGATNLEAYHSGLNPWTLEPVSSPPSETQVNGGTPQTSTNTSVTLSWSIPLTRLDGSALAPGEIDHFVLSYGTAPDGLTQTQSVPGSDTTYTFDSLKSGTWYFSIVAVDTGGLTSPDSAVVSKTIP